ncbi:carboxypeptidase-like regulatory domain-containing protein [Nitrospira sp. Kam-Ns4a]
MAIAVLGAGLLGTSAALATHEVDHRFVVEGYVCGPDGQPRAGVKVTARDTRADIVASALTDSDGFFSARLHLHNENQGDPIAIFALDEEKRITAQFDPKDVHTERKAVVHFGTGCEQSARGTPSWVYYGAGIGAVAVALFAGVKFVRNRRRVRKQGKAPRKAPARA